LQKNPDWGATPVEYPHIEIVQTTVAGSGPHVFALPKIMRRLNFE
jgi:hypothetical protein